MSTNMRHELHGWGFRQGQRRDLAGFGQAIAQLGAGPASYAVRGLQRRRVLRPAGLHVYTVRHIGDAHYGAGTSHGDSMFENGGFIVHFFDRALVDRLVTGFTLLGLSAFEEGSLPRRLWRITLRREDAPLAPPFVPRGTGATKARRLNGNQGAR
jgi:hypothetical protein